MSARISAWMRKQPVVAVYVLAFVFTWLGWVPQALHSRGLFPFDSFIFYIFGGVGPLLAVFIVLAALRGRAEYGEPFRLYLRWQAGAAWWAAALLLWPAMWLATLALGGQLGAELANLAPPLSLLITFAVSFVAAIPEEVAWRGFILPRLQARWSALAASLIVGVFWALWHLPLLLNLNSPMSAYPLGLFFLDVLGRSVVYAWLFNNTRGSLLFVTLFHAMSNTVGTFLGWENIAISYLVAAVLVIVFGAKHLSRQGEQPLEVVRLRMGEVD